MFLAVTVTLLVSTGGGVTAAGPSQVPVIIAFNQQPGPAEEVLVRQAGGAIKYTYDLVPAIAATVPESAIAGLQANPNVLRVEPDIEVHLVDHPTGDAELDNAWGVAHIGSGAVHAGGNKGSGVKVAVIDTGIDTDHPDLQANYDSTCSYDFVNDDSDPEDGHGHGTHTAGTVAALDNNLTGSVVGVAPEVTLCIYKVLSDSGSGSYSDVIAALDFIVSYNNSNPSTPILVTNNSYGSSGDPGATVKAAFDNAYAAGVLHAAAAGNSGNPPGRGDNCIYPALWESLIATAATKEDDNRASFSSTCEELELSAPGYRVNSTWNDGGYHEGSGTSMASPHVAGTAALVIAAGITDANGDGNINDEVRLRLQETADDLGTAGRDTKYGYGLVDADEAAAPSGPDTTAPTVTSVDPLDGATGVDVNTNVVVTFSEPVDSATVDSTTFTVSSGGAVAGIITVAGDGLSATFDPGADLANSTTYTVSVTTGVTDTSGNPLDQDPGTGGDQDFSSSFTTAAADTTAPTVTSVDPTDGATGVAVNTNVVVTFSEPVDSATVDSTTFTVSNGGAVAGIITVAGDGLSATFDPDADLANSTTYTVDVTNGVTDTSGNALDPPFSSSFTTGAAPTTATTVSVASITYATTGGPSSDKHLLITVALLDNLGNPVSDASVSIDLLLNNVFYGSATGTTGTDGTVTFKAVNAPLGTYTTTVTDVTAAGLTWDGLTPPNLFEKT